MEKFSYIQEGGKNYLKSEEISKIDYITQMLIHNDIPAFVTAKFKSLNCENYICYNMNGLIPIGQSFELNKLNAERVEGLLRSIVRLYASMEEFLLPFDRLIVDEAYIYENYNKKNEFYWIYGNLTTDSNFTALFEKLLDKVDYKDEKAVKMMYSMYQAAKDSEDILNKEIGGSSIAKIKEKAEEILSAPYQSLDVRAKELIRQENERVNLGIPNMKYSEELTKAGYKEISETPDSMAKRYRAEVQNKEGKRKIMENPEKSKEKKHKKKSSILDKKIDMKSKLKKVWNYLNSDIGSKSADEEEELVAVSEEPSYNIREVRSPVVKEKEVINNETTLLTGAMVGKGVYCLRSEDMNEDNILLTEFPFFIGKSGENTNHRIDDSTVSRFHARIDKEEDDLWLTDLNSTNGTFLNGIRLLPYDRIKVSRGDSVVISRKRYEFRHLV